MALNGIYRGVTVSSLSYPLAEEISTRIIIRGGLSGWRISGEEGLQKFPWGTRGGRDVVEK